MEDSKLTEENGITSPADALQFCIVQRFLMPENWAAKIKENYTSMDYAQKKL